jgi:hypothetical protein
VCSSHHITGNEATKAIRNAAMVSEVIVAII